eukprot:GFYU01004355.1.p1 GENE.GFYU01004355.1~~GFYU01004355.1.p1  ORF type:complete len:114 (-),score=11.75 GFYU01004355.1:162-503(-)
MASGYAFGRKVIFVYLSLLFSMLLMAANVVDYVMLVGYVEQGLPARWRIALMMVHIGSFYLFLTGFVYANEGDDQVAVKVAYVSLWNNVLAFMMRIAFEITYIDFQPMNFGEY